MENLRTKEVDDLLKVFASIDDENAVFALLEDLFTIREIKETSQRLSVACLLDAGKPYTAIETTTGASATTIARVSKSLNYGSGGYRFALDILKEDEMQS
ncbi:MAG: YerC/YecD family TrpR-related protein [Raoultibacter sp.]